MEGFHYPFLVMPILFPTCQVRVVRFYVSLVSSLPRPHMPERMTDRMSEEMPERMAEDFLQSALASDKTVGLGAEGLVLLAEIHSG